MVRKVWKGRGEGPSDGGEKGGVRPSPALAELFAGVDRSPGSGRVLDLGPAEEATLKFLGDQALEVHVAALEPDPNGEPIAHPVLDRFFDELRDGVYVRHRTIH